MKKIAKAIVFVGCVMFFAACSWQIPEKVSVKSNADYNFSLGTFEKSFDDQMNLQSMMGNAGNNNQDINTFDYFPGKKDKTTQHFLIQAKVYEINLTTMLQNQPGFSTVFGAIPADADFDLSTLSAYGISLNLPTDTKGLDFNPSSMLNGLKDGIGTDLAGKIEFGSENSEIPLYLFCETTPGISANATLKMYYGSKTTPIVKRADTEITLLDNSVLANKPMPDLVKQGDTVITDFSSLQATQYLGKANIKSLINNNSSSIQSNDQMCIEYSLGNLTGTVKKSVIEQGLTIAIYAVIDIPLVFTVKEEINLDMNSLTGNASNSSSASSNSGSNGGFNTNSEQAKEIEKYLDIIDSLSIKYIAYKMPFKSTSGIQLGVDLIGDGNYITSRIVEKEKGKSDEKTPVTIPAATIKKIKDTGTIDPKIKIQIANNSVLKLPREKAVEMNIDINLKTDGTVQVK